MTAPQTEPAFRRELGTVDFTLLVIGAVIGADVYVVAALGASFLGPAQLVTWLAAGVLAALIAIAFVQCAAIYPETGGSYAYARGAFGPLVGFITGWALYVGEWVALPVFPLAFVNYLRFFLPELSPVGVVLVKVALVGAITAVNLVGVRAGGRVNDVLTVAKLVPLGLLILLGVIFTVVRPVLAASHLTPFTPLGWSGFGSATILIFWAYAGFELAVLPAGEVKRPRVTLPRGLILGMTVATLFYLLTAFAVVVALPWQVAAGSTRPLTDAMESIATGLGLPTEVGPIIMSLGGLISILGVYDVFTLSVARLSYAMAKDGIFPPAFAQVHSKYETPYVGLIFQAASGLAAALLFDLSNLIATSVFFLGICYVFTSLSALRLVNQSPNQAIHLPGLQPVLVLASLSGLYLCTQVALNLIFIGLGTMAVGIVLYGLRRHAWREAAEIETGLRRGELQFERWAHRRERWLLRFFWRR